MYRPRPKWWLREKTPAACVVEAFGGPGDTAKALGVAPCTVSNWRTRGKGEVPLEHWELILAKTKQMNTWMLKMGRQPR